MRVLIHQEGESGFKDISLVDEEKTIIEVLVIIDDQRSFSITDNNGIEIGVDQGQLVITPISIQRISINNTSD